jgi:integrase
MSAEKRRHRTRVERGIYRQPNGKYAVCTRHAGVLHFRTAGFDLAEARRRREALIAAVREGRAPASPRLRFDTVAGWWLERFEGKVASGERHPRTLEAHRYQLERHLLPALGARQVGAIGVGAVAELLGALRSEGRSPKTSASALGTLQGILRYARRHDWIRADPVELLESWERPRPQRRQRVLGRGEIERLLGACPPRSRLLVTTALYSGLRISELLGLIWGDVDFQRTVITVRFQLSRARHGEPARRVATKTPASVREVPLVPSSPTCSPLISRPRPSQRPATGSSRPAAAPPMDIATSPAGSCRERRGRPV